MNNDGMKFVEFENWCKECKYADTAPSEEPCDECLGEAVNLNSTKPVNFVEK